jgi:hypothetical protein
MRLLIPILPRGIASLDPWLIAVNPSGSNAAALEIAPCWHPSRMRLLIPILPRGIPGSRPRGIAGSRPRGIASLDPWLIAVNPSGSILPDAEGIKAQGKDDQINPAISNNPDAEGIKAGSQGLSVAIPLVVMPPHPAS